METPLEFHCGECAASLTDATALFTSCGHFFCGPSSPPDGSATCTQLVAGQPGTCEQCGAACNAGVLSNKAKEYDERVKTFVFGKLERDMRSIAEIIEFRTKHSTILRENVSKIRSENAKFRAIISSQAEEIKSLREENRSLREGMQNQPSPRSSIHIVDEISVPGAPCEEQIGFRDMRSVDQHGDRRTKRMDASEDMHSYNPRAISHFNHPRKGGKPMITPPVMKRRMSDADSIHQDQQPMTKSARYMSEPLKRKHLGAEGRQELTDVVYDTDGTTSEVAPFDHRRNNGQTVRHPGKASISELEGIQSRRLGASVRTNALADTKSSSICRAVLDRVKNMERSRLPAGFGARGKIDGSGKAKDKAMECLNNALQRPRIGPRAFAPGSLSRFASSSRSAPLSSMLRGNTRLGPSSGIVPRPSATPDRFSRTVRHPRLAHNPLASQK